MKLEDYCNSSASDRFHGEPECSDGPWGYCDWCDKPIPDGEHKYNGSFLCEECLERAEAERSEQDG